MMRWAVPLIGILLLGVSVFAETGQDRPLPTLGELEQVMVENIEAVQNAEFSGKQTHFNHKAKPSHDGKFRKVFGDSWFRYAYDLEKGYRTEQEYRVDGEPEVHRCGGYESGGDKAIGSYGAFEGFTSLGHPV